MKRKTPLKRGNPPRRKTPFITEQRTPLREIRKDLVVKCCGKKTWATREAAEVALNRIMLISTEESHPRRVYECRNGNFHLTSKPDRYATETGNAIPGGAQPVTHARKAATATVKRWKYTGPADGVRALLITRSGGFCEIGAKCGGFAEGVDPAHRRGKGAGGTSLPESNAVTNLLWACRADHDYIDREEPAEAFAAGWKVRHGSVNPADVPVMIAGVGGGLLVGLAPDGTYCAPPPEVPDGA